MPDLQTSPGVTEIPPAPSNVTHVDAVETPAPAAPSPIQPTPEEKAAYEAQFGPAPLNPIRDLSAQELADLSIQDKDHFDVVSAFRAQPNLHSDPAIVQKAADALNLVKQRGFKLSDLPSPGQAAAGVLHSAKGFGKQLWNYANVGADILGAAATEPFSHDVGETFAKDVDARLSANIAGTEEGMAGIADIGRKVIGKAGRALGISKDFSQYTPQEKQNDLWAEVGRHEVQQERLQGKGPFTAAVTGGVAGEQHLNPEEVSTLAAGDPVSFFAFGKAMEGAGALVPGGIKSAAAATAAKLGEKAAEVVPKIGGAVVQGGGKALEVAAPVIKTTGKVASVALPLVEAVSAVAGEDAATSAVKGLLGGAAGVALKRSGELAAEWAPKVKDFGKQIAGSVPVKGAYAQAGKDFLQALPGAAGGVAKGAAIDLGLAAATAETPQETEGMATFGTALGALHGAGRVAGHMISGQIIAPREYGINTVTPSSGQFKALDAMHSQAIRDAAPGVRARLNAIRQFLGGTESGTDAFLAKDSASVEKALTDSGVDPATAKTWAAQEGFFTADLPGQDGTPRRVVVMRNVEAAPHESFHVIQDVLGESANREIDKIVRDAYADRWDHEGETYAKRLVGNLGGKSWEESILDASGWGLDEAKEKLYFDIANSAREHGAGKELPPGAIDAQVKETLGKIMDAAVLLNPHVDPKEVARHVWRDVLSPEEAKSVADRYIARELAAENFDAAFKAGKTQPPNSQLPAKLGRIAGRLISSMGGEPLADRQSEIGQVPLKTPVVEAVTDAAKAKGGIPSLVTPKAKGGKPKVPTAPTAPTAPTTPEAEREVNAKEARTIADEAPTAIPAGGLSSPRELLGQIAESISKGEGIKLNYLSAPDEPAAATTSNRETRRAIIEAFRKMPADARALWEKTFFPDRVVKTKTGYQVLGWAPEVFASNAHKMAAFLADHTALSPYEIDAATKTFTPAGWKELYSDVQKFVQNQKAGTTGSGEPLVVPKSTSDRGFTAPPRRGGEVALDQNKADFINLLFNFKLPETPRQTKGKLPLNLAGQEVSEATLPGRIEVPVRPRGEYKDEFAGREIKEVNPLRNQVEAAAKSAGVAVPSLIEAVQRLNLENIKEVEAAPEAPEFRGNTLTLSAGFQPVKLELPPEQLAKKIDEMSLPEFTKWAQDSVPNGGYTPIAHEVGMKAPSQEFVNELKSLYEKSKDDAQKLMKSDVDSAFAEMSRGQFYREAFEAADGTASAGSYLRKKLGDAYKPPFPAEAPKAQFNPSQELPYEEQKKVIDEIRDSDVFKTGAGSVKYGENGLRLSIKLRKGVKENIGYLLSPLGLEFKTDEPITKESYTVTGTIIKADSVVPKVQFNPSNEPDAVKRAAVRRKDDAKIFTGETHGEAWRKSGTEDVGDAGFVTNSGEFLDRKQAWKRAVKMGQIEPDAWTPTPGELESVVFENANVRAKYGFKGQAQPAASPDVQKVAEDYAKENKLPYVANEERKYSNLDEPTMNKLADFYQEAKHDPANPEVKASYDALKKETVSQWKAIKAAGYDLEPWTGKGEPYKNSDEMRADIADNNHLFFLPSKGNFKGSENQLMLSDSGIDKLPVNDIFRAVHDFFGHAKEGYQFGPRGEFNAWKAHSELYSPEAQGALAAETLAQNAWVNFGPHMRGESKPAPAARPFAEQKNTILPPELIDEARAQFAPKKAGQKDDWKFLGGMDEFKKAWILPDGSPAQLGGMWHHHWLAEDPEGEVAAKKYGVQVAPFEGVDDNATRESALLKGFARVSLDTNKGRLTVELLASKFNKLRDSIDRMAEENIKDIDTMTVNLLNHAMDVIVDSDSKKLFQYSSTKEKLANLPFSDRDPRLTQAKKITENPVFKAPDEVDEVLPSAYQGEPEFQVFDKAGKYISKRAKYADAEEAANKLGGYVKIARTFKGQAQPQAEQDVLPGMDTAKEYVGNATVANMTSEQLRNHFPEAIVPSPRDLEIPSAITKSPLYKEAGSEANAVEAFANKLVDFANEFKDDPSFKAGSEWYSKFSPQLKKAFGKDAQIFAELLAATSPQTAAAVNFGYAFDALKSLRAGRFDKIIPKFNQGLDMIADDKWVPWYNKELKAGNIPKPPANPTPAAFLEAWIHKHDLKPRQSNGSLYGTHSIPVLQVFARKWLTESRGPKTLNFVKNLVGDGHEATIDLWADRTMRRMGYADHKERWRILPGNGTGVSPEDFAFGQKAFRSAADKLKMKPDALQGALWFAEKKYWHDKGWGKLDLGDFSSEMGKIPMMESGFNQRQRANQTKTKKEEPLDLFIEPRKLK